MHSASLTSFTLLFRFQLLSIHNFTPTYEAAETVLQEFEIPFCHFLEDNLIVVASKFLDAGQNGFKTLAASSTFPMNTSFL